MSPPSYTLDDLQRLDELCFAEAQTLGLAPPETLFHLVQSEEMYDIAARGLPGRYSHYQFGRAYEQQKRDYDRGRNRIYELVVNTRPVHAYLLEGNSLVAQLLVIAHVLGHAVVFEHNRYFGPADKNILSRVRSATKRIDRYIGEHGRTAVEDFIDWCEALEYQRSFDQLAKPASIHEPVWENQPFDALFPDETARRRAEHEAERARFKTAFPKVPQRDILAFVEQHARGLEDWQRDVISIVRTEMSYFVPQMRTQVLNEGVAVTWHNFILQRLMARDERFTTDDFMEFQSMNAGVLHPKLEPQRLPDGRLLVQCAGVNPYLLGWHTFAEVARICTDPTDEEREKWPDWAGQADPVEKRSELIEVYDDAALIAEFLSPRLCVSEDEFQRVRAELVHQKTTMGVPVIEIVDADRKGRGELWLEHRHEGIGLDEEYAKGTLAHLARLWRRPVVVKSIDRTAHDVWYRCEPTGSTAKRTAEPV
jgi:stage V sporulation protein R